jgi:hypothetical protein
VPGRPDRSTPAASPSSRVAADRRRSPRLRLLGEIHGQRVGLDLPLTIVDISAGGFAIESTVCFPDRDVQLFELVSELGGSPLVVAGRAVRTSPASPGAGRYVTGFEFASDQPQVPLDQIRAWLDAVTVIVEDRQTPAGFARHDERRRAPRLDVMGEIPGYVDGLDAPLVVRDISGGGLRIETAAALQAGERCTIRLRLDPRATLTIHARVAHVRPIESGGPDALFECGLSVEPGDESSREMLNVLVDRVTAALSFD